MDLGLVVIVGFVAVGLIVLLGRKDAKPQPQPVPQPVPGPAPLPAPPKVMGFLFLKDVYQEGEPMTVNTVEECHGDGAGCSAQSHGIVDNGTGPYKVKMRAMRADTGAAMPVYVHDGGPRVDGNWVDSGFFDIYLLSKRPYNQIGTGMPCNEFIPRVEGKACDTVPTPAPAPVPGKNIGVVIECAVMNAAGATAAAYRQTVQVQQSVCS